MVLQYCYMVVHVPNLNVNRMMWLYVLTSSSSISFWSVIYPTSTLSLVSTFRWW